MLIFKTQDIQILKKITEKYFNFEVNVTQGEGSTVTLNIIILFGLSEIRVLWKTEKWIQNLAREVPKVACGM